MPRSLPRTAPPIERRQGARLPHWTRDGAAYSITFRLGDSMPQSVLDGWLREREAIIRRAEANGREISPSERARLDELHTDRIEAYLDSGAGSCHLRDPRAAKIVRDALLHFDGERYRVHAWCVMPNHVHVVAHLAPGQRLESVLHSWKSFTSNAVNRALGLTGQLWQVEYYDHLVRDEADLDRCIRYVLENPIKARLVEWPWVGLGREWGRSKAHGQDARATENAPA